MDDHLWSCSPFFFLRDNARNIKKEISLLKTSSVPCFIHMLQLVIKDSLFGDNRIKLLLVKIQKLFAISGLLEKRPKYYKNLGKKKQGYNVELNKSYARESK